VRKAGFHVPLEKCVGKSKDTSEVENISGVGARNSPWLYDSRTQLHVSFSGFVHKEAGL
jgi:hypothetical protein